MGMTLFRLVTAALFPVFLAVAFYQAEKKTRFAKLNGMVKQLIIGCSFGVVAILATEVGIPFDGAVVNVRNAAPLTAGLLFSWPAGLLAGVIGGVERWFSDAGDFTRAACSIATVFAGFFGAAVRRFLMDNKKASWLYGLIVGITCEVLHMLLIFLTNASDIRRAVGVVEACALPMIVANGLSVMTAIIVITVLGKGGVKKVVTTQRSGRKENISQTFQRWLLICVVLAFVATTLFSNAFQTQIAYAVADHALESAIEDVDNDIRDTSDRSILLMAQQMRRELPSDADQSVTQWELKKLAIKYDVTEINLVDKNGIITVSTNHHFVGYDMASGPQSAEFLCLLGADVQYVQDYQPTTLDPTISRKYAAVALAGGGFLQVGFDAEKFQSKIDEQVVYIAENRHIGESGFVIVCNEAGVIISAPEGQRNEQVAAFDGSVTAQPMTRFNLELYGEACLCMYDEVEGYYVLAAQTEEEAMFSKKASVHMLVFMETLVFVALFATIFVLIKRLVVQNIRKINDSLSRITDGDLSVKVNVRDNVEFASLSDDINSTVAALKHYIEEAEARFDKDLEIAKQIQHSALPSVFPPYPGREEFDIYATMDAAKEVGGDFYDFYLLDESHLAFMMADVSGKGIPGAMFMMTTKTQIKSHAESGLAVNDVFTRVNAQLCENNEAGMFVTAWMGVLDLDTGLVRYVNAGHNPPLVKRKNGSYEFIKGRANFVLGGLEGLNYTEQQLQLLPGDEIYLYTDGVTEAHNSEKELFGEARLVESLNGGDGLSVEALCKKIKADVDTFVGEAEQFDDITMLCVRMNELEEDKVLNVAPTMESVPQVAAFVEEKLEAFAVPMKLTAKLMVAFDEIYSNIVRYSGATDAQVRVKKDENILTLVFRDNGKPYNPLEAEAPDVSASAEDRAIGGLGIFMVRKMMDKVDYAYIGRQNVLTLKLAVE